MAPPNLATNAVRQQMLKLLHGPGMAVTVTSDSGQSRSWAISKALLFHHSGYFQRAGRPGGFRESETHQVELKGFEPEVFQMFVEFIYYGRYSFTDNLSDPERIRDSAKTWVLGDYLEAVEFKNFAMRNLHDIYMPSGSIFPKAPIGPELVNYCCKNSTPGSKLFEFVHSILTQNWSNAQPAVNYHLDNKDDWNMIWDRYPELRNDLLFWTNQSEDGARRHARDLDLYLEPTTPVDATKK